MTEQRFRESFARQSIMATIGATLEHVGGGTAVIALPHATHISQQNGFVHAGVISTILDSACGYAGLSAMPENSDVLTVEFKINLMAPAKGERFVAEGRTVKAGRTLTIAQGEVVAHDGDKRTTVAVMTATLMRMELKGG